METSENAVSLKNYIAAQPVSSFPRILQIASGVYLQGSVYDIDGSECCLSTGDLLKVIGRELQTVFLVNVKTNKSQTLASDFQGVFETRAHTCIYNFLGELHKELSFGDQMLPYWFTSMSDFHVGEQIIRQKIPIYVVSVDRLTCWAECQVYETSNVYTIRIPLSTQGQFYEYENSQSYTLEKILQCPVLLKRVFKCKTIGDGTYRIYPTYEMKTLMNMRKGFVIIPSSLEVDVIDVTHRSANLTFIQPLSLEEVCEYESRFPVVAEILARAECSHMFKQDMYAPLQKEKKIIIHKLTFPRKVLTTACKGQLFRFFYIHELYQGKFRLRPREFSTIYEIWTKVVEGTTLSVAVTQNCESTHDKFPSLCIGDHLHAYHHTKTVLSNENDSQEVDVLLCKRESGDDDDEDELEELMLPLYMAGHFVEEVKDKRKYNINQLTETIKLPCEVNVATKDKSLVNDPLPSFPFLRLEDVVKEPVLLVSLLDNVSECFQLPMKYCNISLVLLEDSVPSNTLMQELTIFNKVEELTEGFYYSVRKDLPQNHLPPPRPPKRQAKIKDDQPHRKHAESKSHMSLETKTISELTTYDKRHFTWFERINVLKIDILPKFLYTFQTVPIHLPSSFFRKLKMAFLRFVWGTDLDWEKVEKKWIVQEVEGGGFQAEPILD
ncbi:protein THEMIS2 [Gastrophryne carolinensis]